MLSPELLRLHPEPFSDIVEKLKVNPTPCRTFDLLNEPTKDDLKFLTDSYENEIGLNRLAQYKNWKLIEGVSDVLVNIPPEIDDLSDISAHYHPQDIAALPSFTDLLNINPEGKNFIIDHNGLTYFSEIKKHPLTDHPWRPEAVKELELLHLLNKTKEYIANNINHELTERFLEKMGVVVIQKTWRELSDKNPLSDFKI